MHSLCTVLDYLNLPVYSINLLKRKVKVLSKQLWPVQLTAALLGPSLVPLPAPLSMDSEGRG